MGLSDECGLCAAAPGALEAEREALLGRAAELEQEGAAHAAAAAEAEAMRARAAARAAELEARLRTDFTSRRQTLLQQQEVRLTRGVSAVWSAGSAIVAAAADAGVRGLHGVGLPACIMQGSARYYPPLKAFCLHDAASATAASAH